MCVVSMIQDHYWNKWSRPASQPAAPAAPGVPILPLRIPTQEEVDEFHSLLERAREYDRKHNQEECELQEKRDRLQKLADELGIKINFDGEKSKA